MLEELPIEGVNSRVVDDCHADRGRFERRVFENAAGGGEEAVGVDCVDRLFVGER